MPCASLEVEAASFGNPSAHSRLTGDDGAWRQRKPQSAIPIRWSRCWPMNGLGPPLPKSAERPNPASRKHRATGIKLLDQRAYVRARQSASLLVGLERRGPRIPSRPIGAAASFSTTYLASAAALPLPAV
jgi:hypothetical protein